MLSDLVQYFTVSEDLFIEDYDLVEFIRFIHKHTQDDRIKNCIETAVNKNIEYFIDVFEYGFNEENYLNDMHLGDALNMQFDNNFVTMLLSTLMHTIHFHVMYEDIGIDILLDDGNHCDEYEYKISSYKNYEINRRIDHYINSFILSNIEDYESIDHPGAIDGYTAETERFIISHIKFHDKSLARKIRKAYAKDEQVRMMFNELNYYMINGEFIFLQEYSIECVGYNGCFDMDIVYDGINSLMNDHLKVKNINNESRSFKIALRNFNKELHEYCSDGYDNIFFIKLTKCHVPPKKEIIL